MPSSIDYLIKKNAEWSVTKTSEDPEFFRKLVNQQSPAYLWIGCSDSRVPANDIVGLMPGELFVHRNVANVVYASDLNCQSVVEYAVDVLRVRHIIVCGHYGCGGVKAALDRKHHGLIDNWLTSIKDVYFKNRKTLDAIEDEAVMLDRMCELNVIAQVHSLSHTPVVQAAWLRGQYLNLHGWVYGLHNGLVNDLRVSISQSEGVQPAYRYDG
jgi:carbonic anhydrase